MAAIREGSLEAPQRHPVNWKSSDFLDETKLFKELERVFDICHGCRRCFNLCNSFPTLFDAIDDSETMELDGVGREVYWDVVDHCYLCDMCFMTKCPYVPPHEWELDFPHLMLRAKIVGNKKGRTKLRDKLITSTDAIGKVASMPVVFNAVNSINKNGLARAAMESTLGIHRDADLPEYSSSSVHKKISTRKKKSAEPVAVEPTQGKVVLFATCFGKYNSAEMNDDIAVVFEHNGIAVEFLRNEVCCGMPKLEAGDMAAVERLKSQNIPRLADYVRQGWDIVAPIPSCALIFRQELPMLFPNDEDVLLVKEAMYDPCEYLMIRHRQGQLDTQFKNSLGKVSYQVACHQRVQNIGLKTRELLALVPDTEIDAIERCSGHDGTYAYKSESYESARKIAKPVVSRVKRFEPDHLVSDCILAGRHIAHGLDDHNLTAKHPISLLRYAYGE